LIAGATLLIVGLEYLPALVLGPAADALLTQWRRTELRCPPLGGRELSCGATADMAGVQFTAPLASYAVIGTHERTNPLAAINWRGRSWSQEVDPIPGIDGIQTRLRPCEEGEFDDRITA